MSMLPIARVVADILLSLETASEEEIDLREGVQFTEWVAATLQGLDTAFLRQLIDAFAAITPEYAGQERELMSTIGDDLLLEEVLTADETVESIEQPLGRSESLRQIARIVANYAIFCELLDPEDVDPDTGQNMMTALETNLLELDHEVQGVMADTFATIADEMSNSDTSNFVAGLAGRFGLHPNASGNTG